MMNILSLRGDILRDRYHFKNEIYEINFYGRRIHQSCRDPNDTFQPKEKCVDIATASNLFIYDYNVAIIVTGDRDYLPAIKKLLMRYPERKIILCTFSNSCSKELSNFSHERYQVYYINPIDHQLFNTNKNQ
jgi:hypothetical protein